MPLITTRKELIEYAMRKLGHPVIRINMAEEQASDRLDEAIEKFQFYHYDGYDELSLRMPLVPGQQEYILPDNVISIDEMYRGVMTYYHLATQGQNAKNDLLFNRYTALFRSYDPDGQILTPYFISEQWLSTFRDLVVPEMSYVFNRATHKLTFQDTISAVETAIFFKAQMYYFEADNSAMYNHDWLKKYFVALLGMQWADNINKFVGVPIPSGGTLNSQGILNRYTTEKEALEDEIAGQPIGFWVG